MKKLISIFLILLSIKSQSQEVLVTVGLPGQVTFGYDQKLIENWRGIGTVSFSRKNHRVVPTYGFKLGYAVLKEKLVVYIGPSYHHYETGGRYFKSTMLKSRSVRQFYPEVGLLWKHDIVCGMVGIEGPNVYVNFGFRIAWKK